MIAYILRVIILSVLTLSIVISLIVFFSRIDTEYSEKLRIYKNNYIIFTIAAVSFSILRVYLTGASWFDDIIAIVLIAYLIFMSFTDQRTKLLYDIVSIAMIVIMLVINILSINSFNTTEIIGTSAVILALYILSRFRWLGFGDVLVYTVLALYYFKFSSSVTFYILANLLIANIGFVISGVVSRAKTKSNDKHLPFTLWICIATYALNIILV